MLRLVGRIALVVVLVGVGWTIAGAKPPQTAQPPQTVGVVEGATVTVEGLVNSPGVVVWVDGMTVGQAISASKGMTPKGKFGHIKRAVKDASGNVLRYEQIKNLKLDTPLLAGDVLVIVRKWFSN